MCLSWQNGNYEYLERKLTEIIIIHRPATDAVSFLSGFACFQRIRWSFSSLPISFILFFLIEPILFPCVLRVSVMTILTSQCTRITMEATYTWVHLVPTREWTLGTQLITLSYTDFGLFSRVLCLQSNRFIS